MRSVDLVSPVESTKLYGEQWGLRNNSIEGLE